MDTFDTYCATGLYTLTYSISDRAIENLGHSGCLELPSSSPYKRFKDYLKQEYRSTSKRSTLGFDNTLSAMDMITHSRKQELRKNRMTVKSAVSEKLVFYATKGSFPVIDGSETTMRCVGIAFE